MMIICSLHHRPWPTLSEKSTTMKLRLALTHLLASSAAANAFAFQGRRSFVSRSSIVLASTTESVKTTKEHQDIHVPVGEDGKGEYTGAFETVLYGLHGEDDSTDESKSCSDAMCGGIEDFDNVEITRELDRDVGEIGVAAVIKGVKNGVDAGGIGAIVGQVDIG